MKIITKHNRKDFYDFQFGHDTDDSLVYLRETKFYRDRFEGDKKLLENVYKHVKDILPENHVSYNGFNKYALSIEYVVVGIYPYMYVMPFGILNEYEKCLPNIYGKYEYKFSVNTKLFYIPKHLYDNKEELLNFISDKYSVRKKQIAFTYNPKIKYNKSYASFNGSIMSYNKLNHISNFVIEDQDIFKLVNAPTFILFPNEHLNNNIGYVKYMIKPKQIFENDDYLYGDRMLCLVTNPIFNDLKLNLISYIESEVYSRFVYTDIENFLYSVKHEPINEPDNNTKILNAGFDLKTSFRKM